MQLWWKTFRSLRSVDPTNCIALESVWDLNNHSGSQASLPQDLKGYEIAGRAAEQLLEVLEPLASNNGLSPAQIAVIGICDILKVVQETMKFKTVSFVWGCFCVATKG
jgi:hypothetical protein